MLFLRCTVAIAVAFLLPAVAGAQEASPEQAAGLYELDDGRQLLLAFWGDYYLIEVANGEARHLLSTGADRYSFGPARSVDEPVVGQLTMPVGSSGEVDALQMTLGATRHTAARVQLPTTEHRVRNGDAAELVGSLVLPRDGLPRAVVVVLGGEGPNDRYSEWPLVMDLAAHGIGVFAFDQRQAGQSTGREVSGNYHQRSLAASEDAVAVVRYVLELPTLEGVPVGVAGHSQGGWIGALVAAEVPEVAFYVNSAGNGSPGWRQWRHAMGSWLRRHDVAEVLIDDAETYFDAFFAIYHGSGEWDDYVAALDKARSSEWWPVLRQRYFAEWASVEEADEFAAAEVQNYPEGDFARVLCPALGVFAEYDGSSTPDTPVTFLRGLRAAGNGNVTVRVLPGVNHGMWGVDGYRTPSTAIRLRTPLWGETIRSWILELVEPREEPSLLAR
jgi:pimeloyl-ACP methyl ester carboxylesterase